MAVLTDIEIANQALSKVGVHQQLTTLDADDTTDTGRIVNVHLASVKKALLLSHPWSFAKKRAELSEVTLDTDPLEFEYAYSLPSDCLRPLEVWPYTRNPQASQRVSFEVAIALVSAAVTNVILTDATDAVLIYVSDAALTSAQYQAKVPYHYEQALVWMLAAELAMPLTMKAELFDYTTRRARIAWEQAVALDKNQKQDDPEPDSPFIAARS